jgi:hypothetical protein
MIKQFTSSIFAELEIQFSASYSEGAKESFDPPSPAEGSILEDVDIEDLTLHYGKTAVSILHGIDKSSETWKRLVNNILQVTDEPIQEEFCNFSEDREQRRQYALALGRPYKEDQDDY